jgi:hypothetical protein
MSSTDPFDHLFWLASRSAGVLAWLALSAGMVIGLAMATKVAPRTLTPRLRVAHERIALISLAALAAHGLLLLGDGFLRPTLLDLLVPFSVDHAPLWTGLGQIAGYLTAALSLSYYARQRIGARRWRNAASSRSPGSSAQPTSSGPERTSATCGCRCRSPSPSPPSSPSSQCGCERVPARV